MSKKALTLSIVIPVYNEENHIGRCLEAIVAQTVKPYEVIVVDNNCTDRTVEIARRFPIVKVIRESRQGHAPARNRGFDAATADIIGRIDADSLLANDWVERLIGDFSDDGLAAVTGLGRTDVLPRVSTPYLKTSLWCRGYYWTVHAYYNTITTWGANMAVRRSWWERVRGSIEADDHLVHEDQDLGLLIAGAGGKIIQDNKLIITTAGQTYLYLPKLRHYIRLQTTTRDHHRRLGTFDSPGYHRIGWWRTLPGRLASVPLGIVFFSLSLVFWPLDTIMIELRGSKKWLH